MRIKLLVLIIALGAILFGTTVAFANDPFGGPPTSSSGNGTTTQAAIYVGEGCSPVVKFSAGSALWFKVDTWTDYKLQIWLDDSPLWGAALKYFEGSPDPIRSDQSQNKINGYWLRVYAPDAVSDLLTTNDGIGPDGTEVYSVGMANNNKFIPAHLLWYEARFDGWVYVRVENRMQWDDNAIVCAHREYSPKPQTPTPPPDDGLVPPKTSPCMNERCP